MFYMALAASKRTTMYSVMSQALLEWAKLKGFKCEHARNYAKPTSIILTSRGYKKEVFICRDCGEIVDVK